MRRARVRRVQHAEGVAGDVHQRTRRRRGPAGETCRPTASLDLQVTFSGSTYGHLLPDSEDYLRGLLDAYDERAEMETEAFSR